jgi:hypothetical protein
VLGRSREWTSQLAADPDREAARMARTLMRDPTLRGTLKLPSLTASCAR